MKKKENIGQVMHGLSEQMVVEDEGQIYQNVADFPRISTSKALTLLLVKLMKSYTVSGNKVLFQTEGIYLDEKYTYRYFDYRQVFVEKPNTCRITVELSFMGTHTIRIKMAEGFTVPENRTPMIEDMIQEDVKPDVKDTGEEIIIKYGVLTVFIQKDPWNLRVEDCDGKVFYRQFGRDDHSFMPYEICPLGFLYDPKTGRKFACDAAESDPYEHYYGLGENFTAVDRKGRTFDLWNTNALGTNTDRGYKNIPFYMSSKGYGIFYNTSKMLKCDMGNTLSKASSVMVEGDLLDFFLIYGPSMKEILPRYYDITGWPALPPKWSFGLWISKISYSSREEVETVAKRMRNEDIPCDVIHIDTDWFAENWVCDWKFDEKKFPDVKEMIKNLHSDGYKLSLWQLPYVERGTISYEVYDEGMRNGYFASAANGDMRFPHGLIDFSNPEAVKWFKEDLIKPLLRLGVDVIKVDFGESAPPFFKYAGVDGADMHNLYALIYNQAVYEATVEELGKEKAMIWARSAWAGSQKYPVHWGGDAGTDFGSLASSIKGSLSIGLSGMPFWSSDIGGFWFDVPAKLYIRWSQYGMFCSHARLHGFYTREPWDFGEEALTIFRKYAKLRYRLLPYIYSQSVKTVELGMPMQRAMVYEFPDDLNTTGLDTQYMFGDSLLIAPVLNEEDLVNVYLPEGKWTDFHTDKVTDGGKWLTFHAKLDILPVYVRENAILPMGPEMNYVDEVKTDPYTLHLYPTGGKSEFTVAEDLIHITMNSDETQVEVTISGSDHNYKVVFHNIKGRTYMVNGMQADVIYEGTGTALDIPAQGCNDSIKIIIEK